MNRLKRGNDYNILERLEGGQNQIKTDVLLLSQSMERIDKALNKDNGVKCIQSRLKELETFMIQSKILAIFIPALVSGISCLLGIIIAIKVIIKP